MNNNKNTPPPPPPAVPPSFWEANNNQKYTNTMKDKARGLSKTIGLQAACELLVLPEPIVRGLCFSKLIQADMKALPLALSLDDVIAVSTALNRYREFHREIIVDAHENRMWEALEFEEFERAKFNYFNS